MQRPQKVSLGFWVIVLLFFYGITSVTTADDLTITYAYSLYSGSTAVDFSPNGNYIATGDIDGDVGFWEVGDDEAIDYVNLGGEVQGVTFSPDGRYLAADGIDENHGGVIVWLLDVATRTTVSGTYVHDDADNINSIAYSPDGRYVAVGLDLVWAYLWDLNSDTRNGWGNVGASEVYDVAFSPDGRYLATGNDNGDLTLWELNSWWTDDVNSIDFKPGGHVRSVAFSPDGKYLAADGYDGINTYVNIYNVDTGRVAWQITSGDVYAIAFSPDSEYIALGDIDETITFYSIGANPTRVGEITASDEVLDLAWNPDGTMISDGRDVWNVNKPFTPVADATENKIYWGSFTNGKIQRSNLDGSDVEVVLSGLSSPIGIALDISGGKMYWTGGSSDKIRRANLNGTSVEDILTGLDDPYNIRLDVSDGKVYWTERGSDKIRRANLNGTSVEDLVTSGSHIDGGIALDTTNGKMYWADWYNGSIRRYNLNGSSAEVLLTGLDRPSGIALDVSGGKMYWAEQEAGKIRRANLNGTSVEDLVPRGLEGPFDIALDTTNGKMYWTDWGTDRIQRANLDGSGVENVLIGLKDPSGIALDLPHSVLSDTIVNLGSSPVESPTVGELFTLPLNIRNGENVSGYQATVRFDTTALKYVQSANGDYLPDGAFFIPPVVDGNSVTLAASSLTAESNGDGTLATITFEVVAVKTSTLTLSDVLLTDSAGGSSTPQVEATQIIEPTTPPPPVSVTTVSFSPSTVSSPAIGEQLTLSLNITGGENVSGYQAIVNFDTTALKYVQSDNGDYLPAGAFFIPPKVVGGKVTLASTSLAGESDGDGTLANITFEIVAVKDSTLTLSDVLLTNSAGQSSQPLVEAAQITEPSPLTNGIGLTLPPDLISEVAFGPNSTYFVLTSQFPTLIGVDDADAIYMDCFIKLDLPGVPDTPVDDPDSNDRRLDNPAYFMFPLETARQQLESVKAEAQGNNITTVIISAIGAVAGGVVGSVIPGIGTAVGVISGKAIGSAVGFAVAIVSSVVINQVQAGEKEEAILASTADPVLILQPFDFEEETGRPSGAFEKLFLIPRREIKEIRIVVAQVYRLKSEQTIRTPLPFVEDEARVVTYEGTWNLEDGTFAAPGAHPVSLSDYPPFQQLSPQVQEYFRRHFGEFVKVEAWHIPEATSLLPNYPNPFNPETWIPYQLAAPADVSIAIYTADGKLVRTLALGHQPVGIYESRSRAAYWDGRNTLGEPVASGVYFYTLTTGEFTATRKMLIRK